MKTNHPATGNPGVQTASSGTKTGVKTNHPANQSHSGLQQHHQTAIKTNHQQESYSGFQQHHQALGLPKKPAIQPKLAGSLKCCVPNKHTNKTLISITFGQDWMALPCSCLLSLTKSPKCLQKTRCNKNEVTSTRPGSKL